MINFFIWNNDNIISLYLFFDVFLQMFSILLKVFEHSIWTILQNRNHIRTYIILDHVGPDVLSSCGLMSL